MTGQDEITRTADRLKDALGAAADVMTAGDSPVRARELKVRHAGGWLLPMAAAVSVVVIALAAVFVGHLAGNTAPRRAAAGATGAALPEFYMALDTNSNGSVLAVHRTAGGAVTASIGVPGLRTGNIAADASDRAFFVASAQSCTTAPTVSRFYRIMITVSGKISGLVKTGSPIQGTVADLAVSPDGSRIAYSLKPNVRCENYSTATVPQDVVHIMDLSTGSIRTWHNTATAASPARVLRMLGGLSWTPDGRTLIVSYLWAGQWNLPDRDHNLAVLGLDTSSSGGSLQAHSRVLWHQESCVTCVREALAGPGDSLTAVELRPVGQQDTRQLVVRIPLTSGRPQTVLYSALAAMPATDLETTAVFADSSGQWVITWPLIDLNRPGKESIPADWISGGKLHSLPGTTLPNVIAW